jgi:hypothetical protein
MTEDGSLTFVIRCVGNFLCRLNINREASSDSKASGTVEFQTLDKGKFSRVHIDCVEMGLTL